MICLWQSRVDGSNKICDHSALLLWHLILAQIKFSTALTRCKFCKFWNKTSPFIFPRRATVRNENILKVWRWHLTDTKLSNFGGCCWIKIQPTSRETVNIDAKLSISLNGSRKCKSYHCVWELILYVRRWIPEPRTMNRKYHAHSMQAWLIDLSVQTNCITPEMRGNVAYP